VKVEPKEFAHQDQLDLSAYYFEAAYQRNEWPRVQRIDLAIVCDWFKQVRNGFSQVPNNPIERAVFAMLHVSRSEGRPEDIVWFESLFQTRVGENFSALMERICLLLEPNQTEEKHLRKQMRAMYEFRSAFVHGGLSVIHPMHNEVMDRRADDSYGRTVDLSLYALRVLLACLQRYVERGWQDVIDPAHKEFHAAYLTCGSWK